MHDDIALDASMRHRQPRPIDIPNAQHRYLRHSKLTSAHHRTLDSLVASCSQLLAQHLSADAWPGKSDADASPGPGAAGPPAGEDLIAAAQGAFTEVLREAALADLEALDERLNVRAALNRLDIASRWAFARQQEGLSSSGSGPRPPSASADLTASSEVESQAVWSHAWYVSARGQLISALLPAGAKSSPDMAASGAAASLANGAAADTGTVSAAVAGPPKAAPLSAGLERPRPVPVEQLEAHQAAPAARLAESPALVSEPLGQDSPASPSLEATSLAELIAVCLDGIRASSAAMEQRIAELAAQEDDPAGDLSDGDLAQIESELGLADGRAPGADLALNLTPAERSQEVESVLGLLGEFADELSLAVSAKQALRTQLIVEADSLPGGGRHSAPRGPPLSGGLAGSSTPAATEPDQEELAFLLSLLDSDTESPLSLGGTSAAPGAPDAPTVAAPAATTAPGARPEPPASYPNSMLPLPTRPGSASGGSAHSDGHLQWQQHQHQQHPEKRPPAGGAFVAPPGKYPRHG
ncbi:hypothetical protein H696_00480 [Fonticula alba]|uniref:Uncharacterized protein n=1 Tax=Fonticula alba TaxID=691883 RepID=A0A058ZES5_FONAL|nr:hypothetical protein H696_00480 [Fonticula alba]KCV72910.1 hypothetical protein H696_00480 [Fonticula alba]|eukprot:XP_009492611.1 hypothetical protein H696_00480 [Fonticula alba]